MPKIKDLMRKSKPKSSSVQRMMKTGKPKSAGVKYMMDRSPAKKMKNKKGKY